MLLAIAGIRRTATGTTPAATADRVVQVAPHAARAAVRGSLAGYYYPTLARPGRRDDLLHLSADHGGAFAADRVGLCAIRWQHDRFDELRRCRSGTRGRRAAGDHVTARCRPSTAPTLAGACFAASRGTGSSGYAAASALVFADGALHTPPFHSITLEWANWVCATGHAALPTGSR
jgi:hypothetical protein